MKKYIYCILSVFTFFLCINFCDALSGYTTGTYITVRSGAGTNYNAIGSIPNMNTPLDLVSEELYNVGDPNCSVGWYQINYEGSRAYVCGIYVSIGEINSGGPEYNVESYDARIYGVGIQVRASATSASTLKTALLPGTNVVVQSDKIPGTGCAEGWYKISYYKNDTGYVCSTFIRKKEELISSDTSYERVLKRAGFPESYVPYLVKLHELHPSWTFNAIDTDLSWDTVVNKEEESNYVQDYYLNDTNWSVYTLYPSRESGWQVSTSGVNAFYLDPRNFLSEKFIFMFESLNYDYTGTSRDELNQDAKQTKNYYNTVKNVFKGTYLESDEYVNMFVGAGFTYDVSPVHLATRALLEGSGDITSNAVSGVSGYTYGGYSLYGYYNFYNIGAFVDGVTSNPTARGLAYACGTCGITNYYGGPWDTQEKAIYGGAAFIADGYINAGQNTQYFQKFNTTPNSSYSNFTHQYQTNVTAPASESADSYTSYRDMGLLDQAFVFDIPVYKDMPDTVSLPTIASTVNTLSSITVDGNAIYGFDSDILEYTVYVIKDTRRVDIEATKNDSKSTVTGLGYLSLRGDVTTHKIKVTSESGSTLEYTLIIKKVDDTITINDILSKLSTKQNGNVMYNISPDTLANAIVSSIQKQSATTEVVITNPNGTVVDSTEKLKTGEQVKITTPAGETKIFTIAVTGDTSGDGEVTILDLLKVQKHILGTTPLNGVYSIAADASGDGQITILDLLKVQKHILGNTKL